jgi:transcription antitermination factor NusG
MKKWYAIYTKHRHEKMVNKKLLSRGIESYLPLYSSLRLWKDRKEWVDLPVFPNYLFVHCELTNYISELRRMRGVIKIVGHPAPESIPDSQIESIKKILTYSPNWDYLDEIPIGKEVLIINGCLKGVRGILVEKRNNLQLAVQIDLINNGIKTLVKPEDIIQIEDSGLLPCSILNNKTKVEPYD